MNEPAIVAIRDWRIARANMAFAYAAADVASGGLDDEASDKAYEAYSQALAAALLTEPSTFAGVVAYVEFGRDLSHALQVDSGCGLSEYWPGGGKVSAEAMFFETLVKASRKLSAK